MIHAHKYNQRGFTLVEIMIVVAIIALLAAIAIPNFIKARSRSGDSRCMNNFRQIVYALEQVAMEENLSAISAGAIAWNAAPATGTWGVISATGYLKVPPVCPMGGTYSALGDVNGQIRMTCSGANHNTTAMYSSGGGAYWVMQ